MQVLAGRRAAELKPLEARGADFQSAASPLLGTRAVVLDDRTELPFDSLIVATGARGAKLAIPGADLAGVYGLRDLEDLQAISRLAAPGRRAVVLGGNWLRFLRTALPEYG